VGSTGRVSETFINPAIMNAFVGTKFKIVTGYKAQAEVNLAPQRDETHGAFTTWNNISNIQADALKKGEVRIVVQIAPRRHPDLKDVPLVIELASNDEARAVINFMTSSSQMGQSYVAPPGVSAPILAALRKAFDATMKDRLHRGIEPQAANSIRSWRGTGSIVGGRSACLNRSLRVIGLPSRT
jgi:hypothetical protein